MSRWSDEYNPCPHCHGSGVMPGQGRTLKDGMRCLSCAGTGERQWRDVEEDPCYYTSQIERDMDEISDADPGW